MSNGDKKVCGECAFFEAPGYCKFTPPPWATSSGDQGPPRVDEDSWCGSWQPLSWRELPEEPKKPRMKPSKAPQTGATVVPDQPTPKDVLAAWDAVYEAQTGNPYTKGGRAGEAANASRLIKAIAKQDKDWSRIERAMTRFHNDSWARGQDFNVFAQKFSQFDAKAQPKRAGGFFDGE